MVQQDRIENQGEMRHFMGGPMINVNIRRNYLYEDAFEKLSLQNGELPCVLTICFPSCAFREFSSTRLYFMSSNKCTLQNRT